MAFFRKKQAANSDTLRVDEVKVATTIIVSSYEDGSGLGPRCVKWYFLVRKVDGKYHEIFSNKQIEEETDTNCDGFVSQNFDTPYIEKLEPLTFIFKKFKYKGY